MKKKVNHILDDYFCECEWKKDGMSEQ